MPLQRMNASTPEELRETYDMWIARNHMTTTFKRFFYTDQVNDFFYDLSRPEDQLFAFSQYYDDDRINQFMCNKSPRPDIYALWNEWSNTQ